VTYCRGFTPAKQQQPDLCPISVAQQLAENNQQKVDALEYAKLFQTQTVQKDKEIQDLYAFHDLQITKLNQHYLDLQSQHTQVQIKAEEHAIALQVKHTFMHNYM